MPDKSVGPPPLHNSKPASVNKSGTYINRCGEACDVGVTAEMFGIRGLGIGPKVSTVYYVRSKLRRSGAAIPESRAN